MSHIFFAVGTAGLLQTLLQYLLEHLILNGRHFRLILDALVLVDLVGLGGVLRAEAELVKR